MAIISNITKLSLLLLISVMLFGCGTPQISVSVESLPDTNQRNPFYLVIRNADKNTFLTESYQSVVNKVFQVPPDTSIVKAEVIYPGETQEISLEPTDKPLAFYFLFTNPGDRWKAILLPPIETSIAFELDKNQIRSQE